MNHNIEIPSQPSRRHSRNDEQAAHPAQGTAASSPRPLEASEYFILNHSQTNSPHQEEAMPPTAQPAHSSPPPSESRDVKKCWVCQQDETDDTPDNSVWRSPCPCSLRAHERCLFEWIADTEAPRPGDVASSKTEIVCPQCKTPYRITRPKDVIVMVTSEIERAAKFMILPTAASAVFGTVYSGLLVYGINSLQLIFGYEEAARIMTPGEFSTITDTPYPVLRKITTLTSQVLWQIKVYMDPFFPMVEATANLKAFFGLPLIAPTLLLSRVGLADELSLTVPVIYLVAFNSRIRSPLWPPRAGMTFAFIPFLRLAYKILYQRVFAELENKWDKAVQRPPREGETAEDIALAQANNDNNDEVFIDIEVQVHEHTSSDEESQAGDDERLAQNEPLEGRRAEVVARVDGDEHREHIHVDNELAAILNDAQAPENQNRHRRHQHLGAISTFQIASTTMGALLFPAVSSIMGDLLKLTLPTRWVSGRAGASGILSQKWGRSVVGGCLFVVLKDVVVLYCKWKNARDFGKRKIVDFVADRK